MTEEERREFVIRRDNYYGQTRAFRDRVRIRTHSRREPTTTASMEVALPGPSNSTASYG
jgi:hypothetical protein